MRVGEVRVVHAVEGSPFDPSSAGEGVGESIADQSLNRPGEPGDSGHAGGSNHYAANRTQYTTLVRILEQFTGSGHPGNHPRSRGRASTAFHESFKRKRRYRTAHSVI